MSRYLQQGSTGPDVLEVETRLAEEQYVVGPVDEVFDEKTDAAVRYFQLLNDLEIDGVVGPQTRAALGIPERDDWLTGMPGTGAPGTGTGGPAPGGDDLLPGEPRLVTRILTFDALPDLTTFQVQVMGPEGGTGWDEVCFVGASEDVTERVLVAFEVSPGEVYQRTVPTPGSVRSDMEANPGGTMRVILRTNLEGDVGGGESDLREVTWPGPVVPGQDDLPPVGGQLWTSPAV